MTDGCATNFTNCRKHILKLLGTVVTFVKKTLMLSSALMMDLVIWSKLLAIKNGYQICQGENKVRQMYFCAAKNISCCVLWHCQLYSKIYKYLRNVFILVDHLVGRSTLWNLTFFLNDISIYFYRFLTVKTCCFCTLNNIYLRWPPYIYFSW